ncbi:MAG TPA: nucleotidyl transferase AbiEii/AbiGii toxin family protein [Chloroflexi bacterium]|nr:MAG: hypothetical protein B6243_02650 [Anaerolineaceae bacterium 4572_5.2]HEY86261.1 nucleotidyl transferase AbiEii/AbiGii toxin family protein [Chloroflexota bacterium]
MAVLKKIHWDAVTPQMRDLLEFIGRQPFSQRFYLAGGTALALRLGHRYSVDLDFFSETDEILRPTRREILQSLTSYSPEAIEDVDGNLLLLVPVLSVAKRSRLRVGFFGYGYRLLQAADTVENVAVASIVDIGLMKLDALISRGSRKDFYDLYFITQQISLSELLALGKSKYPYARDFELMAVESLLMFENADRDLQPDMVTHITWETVRDFFISEARKLAQHWFGNKE